MRNLLLSFILFASWIGISAGTLNTWTNYNFQGVWDITSAGEDGELGWLIRNIAGDTFGNAPITKVELALDATGWGYITFYSYQNAGQFDIRGRIFTPNPSENRSDYLSLLCANDYTNLTYGLISVNVGAYNGDASDVDAFSIYPVVGSGSARAIRTSSIYIPGALPEIMAPSVLLQFMEEGILVRNADNAKVSVCDLDGVFYYQTQNYTGETIKLVKGSCYIVSVDDKSMKILF